MGAWNKDGVIVFGTRGIGPLYRVPASGGTPVPLSAINESRVRAGALIPVFLPDQKRFLYVKLSGREDVEGVYVRSIDDKPDQDRGPRLLRVTLGPLAVADHGQGRQLLFIRDGTLMSQPFDADRVQLSGDAQPVAEHLGSAGSFAFFAAGGDVLAYRRARRRQSMPSSSPGTTAPAASSHESASLSLFRAAPPRSRSLRMADARR